MNRTIFLPILYTLISISSAYAGEMNIGVVTKQESLWSTYKLEANGKMSTLLQAAGVDPRNKKVHTISLFLVGQDLKQYTQKLRDGEFPPKESLKEFSIGTDIQNTLKTNGTTIKDFQGFATYDPTNCNLINILQYRGEYKDPSSLISRITSQHIVFGGGLLAILIAAVFAFNRYQA